jgi:hypothetical protein
LIFDAFFKPRGVRLSRIFTKGAVRRVSVLDWSLAFYGSLRKDAILTLDGDSQDCFFEGRPMRNWLFRESSLLMRKADRDSLITVRYGLKRPLAFQYMGAWIVAKALEVGLSCGVFHGMRSRAPGLWIYRPIAASGLSGMPEIDEEIGSRTVRRAFP